MHAGHGFAISCLPASFAISLQDLSFRSFQLLLTQPSQQFAPPCRPMQQIHAFGFGLRFTGHAVRVRLARARFAHQFAVFRSCVRGWYGWRMSNSISRAARFCGTGPYDPKPLVGDAIIIRPPTSSGEAAVCASAEPILRNRHCSNECVAVIMPAEIGKIVRLLSKLRIHRCRHPGS